MKDIKSSRAKKIIEYLNDENISMNRKKFYLVTGYVVPVLLIALITVPFVHYTTQVVIMEIAYILVLLGSAYIVWRFEEYRLFSYVLSIATCFFILPAIFFTTGYIYNGGPVLIAASVILTFFLVEDRGVYIIVFLELVYYALMFIFCFQNREMLSYYLENNCTFPEKVMIFLFGCLLPVLIVSYQTALFENIKLRKEQSYISIRNSELSKIRFLANMTHEIRNPMNAIVGMNELILKEELTPGAREQAQVIKEASSQLLRIVNNILIYSKLDSNKWEAVPVKYSFKELMREVIDNVSRGMQEEGAEFYVFVDRNIPSYLFGDSQGVKQVFMYLLYNSIQQTIRRSMSLEVKAEKVVDEHMLRFKCRIAETGSGMPEADVDSLLGAFNKYDSRRNATLKGLGLEISICNELLSMMDGFLKIESVVDVGTAIIFEFSNYIIDDTPMLAVDESMERHVLVYLHDKDEDIVWKRLMEDIKISPVYAAGPVAFKNEIADHRYTHIFIWQKDYEPLKDILRQTMCEEITYIITDFSHVYRDFGDCRIMRKPISCLNIIDVLNGKWSADDYMRTRTSERYIFPDARILVVDDSLVNLKVLGSVLENFGIEAKSASSGKECLEILKNEEFDLILLDHLMPEMDGIEALRRIKQIPGKNSKIPVLCVTAELGRDVGERLMEEGFDDYIAKPVKDYHLARLLKKYLPDDLAIVIENAVPEKEDTSAKAENTVKEEEGDPLSIDTVKGIENVGGDEDVYYIVLSTYYHEGLEKWKAVPEEFLADDIPLFTTNVHALKSSSASIGAYVISEKFKKLEFAGKENNRTYIEANLDECLENFRVLLERVKDMLVERGVYEEPGQDMSAVEGLEETAVDKELITDLQQSLNSVNLKRCEEILESLGGQNFGSEINSMIKKMKDAYEMFDYHTVKDLTAELLDNIQ
ncbi:MAG: response regulator [Lachnospiraceae bacterium]|nr:response regulator [Lachnospiraceae bacterium]